MRTHGCNRYPCEDASQSYGYSPHLFTSCSPIAEAPHRRLLSEHPKAPYPQDVHSRTPILLPLLPTVVLSEEASIYLDSQQPANHPRAVPSCSPLPHTFSLSPSPLHLLPEELWNPFFPLPPVLTPPQTKLPSPPTWTVTVLFYLISLLSWYFPSIRPPSDCSKTLQASTPQRPCLCQPPSDSVLAHVLSHSASLTGLCPLHLILRSLCCFCWQEC